MTQQPCELAAAFVSTPHDVADKAPRPLGAGSAGPQGKRADAAALVLRCPAIGRALVFRELRAKPGSELD